MAAGRCEGHGQVFDTQQTRSNKAAWPKIAAASSVLANTGELGHCCCSGGGTRSFRQCTSSPHALLNLQTLKSTQAMADAMRGATKVSSGCELLCSSVHGSTGGCATGCLLG